MRRRTCADCEKPLGGTLAHCHEHGGEDTGSEMTDVWGPYWKLELGVSPALVFEQHSESEYLNR